MVKRVAVKSGAAKQVTGISGEGEPTGTYEYTVLNTDATATVELVESSSASFGTGFPLAPGAAWSARCAGNEVLYVITNSGTNVSVAVIGVQVPA